MLTCSIDVPEIVNSLMKSNKAEVSLSVSLSIIPTGTIELITSSLHNSFDVKEGLKS